MSLSVACGGREKELSVQQQAVGGSEGDLLRSRELCRGKIGWDCGWSEIGDGAAFPQHRGPRGRRRARVKQRNTALQSRRPPLEAASRRQGCRRSTARRHRPDVQQVDPVPFVRRVQDAVSIDSGRGRHYLALANRERYRCRRCSNGGYRVESVPASGLPWERDAIVCSPDDLIA